MPTYRNDSAYTRSFFDLENQTLELGPYEEIDFDHIVHHPNLFPVSDDAVAAYIAARAPDSEPEPVVEPVSTAVRARDEVASTSDVASTDPATPAVEAASKE